MNTAPPRLSKFLARVGDPSRPGIPAGDVAVVIAHPDDETIGCGALLVRLAQVNVIVVTNGAPPDCADASARGFSDDRAYTAARSDELDRALQIAGVAPDRLVRLDVPDQHTAHRMPQVIFALGQIFEQRGIAIVLTHAYEGGHPDHDAVAYCVQAAARRAGHTITIVEMPYYRLGEAGEERQSFADERHVLRVVLNETERANKRRMIEAHETQKDVLAGFSLYWEQFRAAPLHDFSRPPNGGRVLYDERPWGITSSEWLACAKSVPGQAPAPP